MSAAQAWSGTATAGGGYYRDPQFGCQAYKLLPGEYHVTAEALLLVTVLGSCVSACMRDPEAGVGGMNHFMLPDSELAEAGAGSARYGSYAMEVLINELLKKGARRARIEAKVFGGGNVLRSLTTNLVGTRNAEFVRSYLAAEGIAIKAEDLGGVNPRKIFYFPDSGRVMVRKLDAVHSGAELSRESDYRSRLSRESVAGDVELFS